MSVPFRLIQYDQAVAAFSGRQLAGQPPKARAFTIKISADKENLVGAGGKLTPLRRLKTDPP